jgi:phospholipid-translocating P-type ATPase (flippase)
MLAACHTVMLEQDPATGEVSKNADSPDEVALVDGAACFGHTYAGQVGPVVVIKTGGSPLAPTIKTGDLEYEILNIIAFNSARKRMTTIVRQVGHAAPENAPIQVWCKGADNVIIERLREHEDKKGLDTVKNLLRGYAQEGLRTLCFAKKNLAPQTHKDWAKRWREAEVLAPDKRQPVLEKLAAELECNFSLVGASAIEDKLQEAVPETIVRLTRAQIKLWVLTGDKQETAIEIGRSTRLLVPSMYLHILNADSAEKLTAKIERALAVAAARSESPQGLVIDGATLGFVLTGSKTGRLKRLPPAKRFFELARACRSVIVCRSSPLQKALVVMLVKYYLRRQTVITLAIGDGANDVSMIRAANVGVGISGLEGMQAVQSADYAIQKFKDLDRLLLFHGRMSYQRVAYLGTYFFYKCWMFTIQQWLFGFYNGFSGQSFFYAIYVPLFNMLFTGAPISIMSVLEQDIPERKALPMAELYQTGQRNKLFSGAAILNDLAISVLYVKENAAAAGTSTAAPACATAFCCALLLRPLCAYYATTTTTTEAGKLFITH